MTKRYLSLQALAASAALALGGAVAGAADPQPTTADLTRQIEQLQAKVAQMEATQQQQEAATAKTVDATVERVLRDADNRSKLLQVEGMTAGWNDGRFVLGSVDGDFSISPFLLMQVRNTTTFVTGGDDDDTENGFNMPNVYLGFDGRAFKNVTYQFLWNSGESGGLSLEQAWMKYQFADQFGMRAGQFVDPVFKEQLTGAGGQLAADRSLLNQIITGAGQSFTQGVTGVYSAEKFRSEFGFTDGVNTGNTSFRDWPTGPTNWAVVGRVEFMAAGTDAQYADFSAYGNKEGLLVFGAAADFTQSGDTNNVLHTIDVQWETDHGLGLYAAYVGQYLMNGAGTGITGVTDGNDDNYNWGVLLQAGWCFQNNWELFGRYDYTSLADEIAAGTDTQDTFNEFTIGVNYYFHGQNAKFTVDLTYLPDGAPSGAENLGMLGSEDNEYLIRAQLQLML